MTPSQMKDRNPDWKGLTAVTASISAAVVALGVLGFRVLNPAQQLTEYATQQKEVTARIEAQIREQSRRIDSVAVVLDRVNSLVAVKCIETSNPLVRRMLECPR